jgi:outer membrane biosynthesis protein TonB
MDITLKSAFAISSLIHAAIAVPLYKSELLKSDFVRKDPVIVDYIILKEISNLTIANTGRRDAAPGATDRLDIKKTTLPAPPEAHARKTSNHTRSEYLKRFEAAKLKEKKRELALKAAAAPDAARDAAIRSTRDYQDYYAFLKEKLKDRLQDNYRYYKGEGDVYVSFVLDSKGRLISYSIDRVRSARDEVLLHITGASLMAVSPFPPLPKAISQPSMSFGITVSFKK